MKWDNEKTTLSVESPIPKNDFWFWPSFDKNSSTGLIICRMLDFDFNVLNTSGVFSSF